MSHPSRTQQLANPKLVPQLMSDLPNDLLRTKGVADEQLAKLEEERGRKRVVEGDGFGPAPGDSRKRARSISSYSSSSVSTISTNYSRSRTPQQHKDFSPSPSRSPTREREMSASPSERSYFSASSVERRGSRSEKRERNTRRRRQMCSPSERGRHYDSDRRGSWRTRSRSESMDKSRIAKQRRSLTPGMLDPSGIYSGRERNPYLDNKEPHRGEPAHQVKPQPRESPDDGDRTGYRALHPRKGRSLSPFSKRLALTQAMNMGR